MFLLMKQRITGSQAFSYLPQASELEFDGIETRNGLTHPSFFSFSSWKFLTTL